MRNDSLSSQIQKVGGFLVDLFCGELLEAGSAHFCALFGDGPHFSPPCLSAGFSGTEPDPHMRQLSPILWGLKSSGAAELLQSGILFGRLMSVFSASLVATLVSRKPGTHPRSGHQRRRKQQTGPAAVPPCRATIPDSDTAWKADPAQVLENNH